MKKTLLTLLLTFTCFVSNGQNCFKGKIEEVKQLTERPLAVIIYEEDENYVKRLEKKIAKSNKKKEKYQKELNDYKNHISYFNKNIKDVVTEYWKLNKTHNIQYFTNKQVEDLIKNKSNSFAILNLTIDVVMADLNTLSTMDIYAITYGASEKNRKKAVYKNHITNVNYNLPGYADKELKKAIEKLKKERENGPTYLSKENMITSLVLSQKYIEKAINLNKKVSFEDFAEEEMKRNCSKLKGNTILFQEAIVHGKIKNELQSLLPKAKTELVSPNRIAEAVANKEDVLIGFPIIKKLMKQRGGFGPVTTSTVIPVTHKVIMNAKTKEIIGFIPHSGITSYSYFKKKDFKKLNEQCN
ncbi:MULTISPECIES: hypothetical protein [Tenacibaculum]|uniref:Uncharacterized protein n=1 Tax=Tenacibaculum discolor TaxID=361581 RepID=A0A2G1BV99_9FLAO|nr:MULTISPECIES: hypothetical protein [Tenacibaculum]MDP2540004.1 hypothetical protein [Tenacibaculum discolor]NVK09609.1 hypothetical protein [Tenacibaculum sp.]PHN97967.1 hypothetical protein CSC81_06045 [Tenacibaculum discolor]PHO00553.1 hypothetical protein CSC82_28305 [Rhodobacteraceae bacterium 4F10]